MSMPTPSTENALLDMMDHVKEDCPERKQGKHCWHPNGNRVNTGNSILFPMFCCFCAPCWMHQAAMMPRIMSDEDLTAAQMVHGPRITLFKEPVARPKLVRG